MVKYQKYLVSVTILFCVLSFSGYRVTSPKDTAYIVADKKLNELHETGYWKHSNITGESFSFRVKNVGHSWIGENLYRRTNHHETTNGFYIEEAIFKWKASPAHNEVWNHEWTDFVLIGSVRGDTIYIVYMPSVE